MLETLPERRLETAQDVIVLAAVPSHEIDGIHDYARHLAESLGARRDVQVTIRNLRAEPSASLAETVPPAGVGSLTIMLQYNPFSFGRWGFAPWLPAKLWRVKRSRPNVTVALMAHEMYVPITDWRSALMGGWQRLQFFAVRVLSDVVFTSISAWATGLQTRRPRRPVYHLPVASNLPDMRHARASQRARLGVGDDTLVLATFGTGHPSRMMDYVSQSAELLASMGIRTMLLNLGSGAPAIRVDPSIRVLMPGRLEQQEIARCLAAADIYLAPFVDGVSTRRTTLMAALQHGLPVIGTDGPLTDPVLREATTALRLTPVGDPASFAMAVGDLATDAAARAARGTRARELYEEKFDWSILTAQLLSGLLDDTAARP